MKNGEWTRDNAPCREQEECLKRLAIMAVGALICLAAACGKKPAPVAENKTPANTLSAATTLKIQEAGLQLDVPAGWQAEKRDEQHYAVASPDGAFQAVFFIPAGEMKFTSVDDDPQAKQADEAFKQKWQNIKAEAVRKDATRNGLKMWTQSGTADIDGAPQRWSTEFIQADKLVVVTYTQRGPDTPGAAELRQSIKKIS